MEDLEDSQDNWIEDVWDPDYDKEVQEQNEKADPLCLGCLVSVSRCICNKKPQDTLRRNR